jgi:hypothetical protein
MVLAVDADNLREQRDQPGNLGSHIGVVFFDNMFDQFCERSRLPVAIVVLCG